MVKDEYMVKGFRQIAFLTAISRVFGMLRDISFAYFFGANWLSTAWFWGFKIPNLSRRLFGEGAASASFIPVYTEELHKDRAHAERLANTVLTVLFTLLCVIVIAGELCVLMYYKFADPNEGTQLGLKLCSVMLPYTIFVCIVAILAGILNVHRHFAMPAAAPIALNICIITAIVVSAVVFGMEGQQLVYIAAAAVLFAGVVQIYMQLVPLRRQGIELQLAWQVRSKPFKKILLMMAPMIIGLTVTQINTFADDLIALFFSRESGKPFGWGAVSHLYYAQRMYQLPLGIFGISLATAIFPVMSAQAAKKDYPALCKSISRGIKAAVFIAVPATIGLLIVAKPLIAAIFEYKGGKFTSQDTDITAVTLSFYAIGLCGFFSQQILTRAFYSMKDSKTPMYSAIIAVVLNIALNLTLIWPLGTGGLALSTAICSYLQVMILIAILTKRFGKGFFDGFGPVLLKTIVATVIMSVIGLSLMYFLHRLPSGAGATKYDILRLMTIVPACAGTYYIVARILKNEMLALFGPSKH